MKNAIFAVLTINIFIVVSCSGKVETVKVKNDTGFDACSLNISNSENTHWDGNNVLGNNNLKNGETRIVNIPTPLNEKDIYDFRLWDDSSRTYIKYGIRVNSNSIIIISTSDLKEE
jgi:hypothetical protein